jgi:hypothetical protein
LLAKQSGLGSCGVVESVSMPNIVFHDAKSLKKIILDNTVVEFFISNDKQYHMDTTCSLDSLAEPEKYDVYDYQLDELRISIGGVLSKKFVFQYGNWRGRLQLLSITEYGYRDGLAEQGRVYRFDYYAGPGTGILSRRSGKVDLWGYYNGRNSECSLGTQRIPKFEHAGVQYGFADRRPAADVEVARSGALRSITYPTGGYTDIAYEQHDYGAGANRVVVGGVRVSRIDSCDGTHNCRQSGQYLTSTSYEYVTASGASSGELVVDPQYKLQYQTVDGDLTCLWGYSEPIAALGLSQGSHIVYREVTVRRQGAGRSRHLFRTPNMLPPVNLANEQGTLMNLDWLTSRDWMVGQNIRTEHFAEDNSLVRVEMSVYQAHEGYASIHPGQRWSVSFTAFWTPALYVRSFGSIEPTIGHQVPEMIPVRAVGRYKRLSGWFPVVRATVEDYGD